MMSTSVWMWYWIVKVRIVFKVIFTHVRSSLHMYYDDTFKKIHKIVYLLKSIVVIRIIRVWPLLSVYESTSFLLWNSIRLGGDFLTSRSPTDDWYERHRPVVPGPPRPIVWDKVGVPLWVNNLKIKINVTIFPSRFTLDIRFSLFRTLKDTVQIFE